MLKTLAVSFGSVSGPASSISKGISSSLTRITALRKSGISKRAGRNEPAQALDEGAQPLRLDRRVCVEQRKPHDLVEDRRRLVRAMLERGGGGFAGAEQAATQLELFPEALGQDRRNSDAVDG